jgi:flagellin-like protein
MQLKRFVTDDNAVSPVIGVILMVAITVILAAVIGTFVLGLGGGLDNDAPQMSFDFKYDEGSSDSLEVRFDAGNTVDAERLSLVLTGAADNSNDDTYEFTGTGLNAAPGEFSAGSSVTLDDTVVPNSGLDLSSATVKIVWESQNTNPDAQRTATVAVWNGPSA